VRKANGSPLPEVSHDPEYEHFIHETGFEFERDLDAAALAVHYPANWPGGGTDGSAPEPRFSEVFIGKFHGERLSTYLKKIAKSIESYESVDIFTIPLENRMFRVAILSVDSVAASNHDDPAVIRGMVDRSRRLASPFGGPAMLRRYYKRVQIASPLWLVAHVQPSAPAFGGWDRFFSGPAEVVISASANPLLLPLRPGALHVKAEALTSSSDDARAIASKLTAFLAIFHSAEGSVGSPGSDPDVKSLFDSLQVRADNEKAVLTATVPPGFVRKLVAEAPEQPISIPEGSAPGHPDEKSHPGNSTQHH
jgi:hypothetical protein